MSKKQTAKTTEQANGTKIAKANTVPEAKPTAVAAKPAKAERVLSNLALGRKLLAEKADEKKIVAAFTEAYKRKGMTDAEFIAKRAAIYLRIASKS